MLSNLFSKIVTFIR